MTEFDYMFEKHLQTDPEEPDPEKLLELIIKETV